MSEENEELVTTDLYGRPYAKISELQIGDILESDGDFTCLGSGEHHIVLADLNYEGNDQWFIRCSEGTHMLSGQSDDGEHLIGLYKVS